ncbi:helix-turn-helix domain-containing protein [Planctomycetota bacterium]
MLGPLELHRRSKGLTQRRLAKLIGRSPSLISGVERGWVTPSAEFRRRCSEALGIPVEVLFPKPHQLYVDRTGKEQ